MGVYSPMKLTSVLIPVALGASLVLSSCYTTSISNPSSSWSSGSNQLYDGELSEYDVLGIRKDAKATDAAIAAALGKAKGSVRLRPGSRILLVQSGSPQPDGALQKAFEQHYTALPFTGAPQLVKSKKQVDQDTARRLRLAAAHSGASHVICVWGTLDSTDGELATKTVSWVPIAGMLIPDETMATRINLKAIVVDVRSGSWRSVATEPIVAEGVSSRIGRERAWTRIVEGLKAEAYPELARQVGL